MKGRGASKKRKKSSQQLEGEEIMAEKSLVRMEEEEMEDDKKAATAIASSVATSIMGSSRSGVADASASMMPSLQDTLMHQNLADIHGIAGSHNMVHGLTAALKQKSEMGSEHMV